MFATERILGVAARSQGMRLTCSWHTLRAMSGVTLVEDFSKRGPQNPTVDRREWQGWFMRVQC